MAHPMDPNVLEGKWKQLRGQVRKTWGKITDDDLDQIQGSYDRLIGMLQVKYGYTQQQAGDEINNFLNKVEAQVERVLEPNK